MKDNECDDVILYNKAPSMLQPKFLRCALVNERRGSETEPRRVALREVRIYV